MAINHGLGDPKAMARAAADGKPVNIPAHAQILYCTYRTKSNLARYVQYKIDGVTDEIRLSALMVWRRRL